MRDLNPKNITRKIFNPPESKRGVAADGIQWRCSSCKKDLFGIWHGGKLHIQHRQKAWVVDGIVRASCYYCGLQNLLDTRIVAVNLIMTNNGWGDLLPATSPQAAKLMQTHHLDQIEIQGSGKGGKITLSDVRTYLSGLPTNNGKS